MKFNINEKTRDKVRSLEEKFDPSEMAKFLISGTKSPIETFDNMFNENQINFNKDIKEIPQALPEIPQEVPQEVPQALSEIPQALPEIPQEVPQEVPQALPEIPQALPEIPQEVPQEVPQALPEIPQALPEIPKNKSEILKDSLTKGLVTKLKKKGILFDDKRRVFTNKGKLIKTESVAKTAEQVKTKTKKDPLFTTIGPGRVFSLRKDEGIANVIAKIYNLMKKSYDDKIKNAELEKNFQKEKKEESERRHKEFIQSLMSVQGKIGSAGGDGKTNNTTQEEEKGSIIEDIIKGVGEAILGKKLFDALKRKPKVEVKGKSKVEAKGKPKVEPKVKPKVGNVAERLKGDLSKKDLAKLEKKGFKFNEKTGQFTKNGRFVSAKSVAEAAGKKLPETATKVGGKDAAKLAGKVAEKSVLSKAIAKRLLKAGGSALLKKLPLLSVVAGVYFAANRAVEGDLKGAGMELASGAAGTIPVAGTVASSAIDVGLAARDVYKDVYDIYPEEETDKELQKQRLKDLQVALVEQLKPTPQQGVDANKLAELKFAETAGGAALGGAHVGKHVPMAGASNAGGGRGGQGGATAEQIHSAQVGGGRGGQGGATAEQLASEGSKLGQTVVTATNMNNDMKIESTSSPEPVIINNSSTVSGSLKGKDSFSVPTSIRSEEDSLVFAVGKMVRVV